MLDEHVENVLHEFDHSLSVSSVPLCFELIHQEPETQRHRDHRVGWNFSLPLARSIWSRR